MLSFGEVYILLKLSLRSFYINNHHLPICKLSNSNGMSRRGDLHEASKRDDEYDSRRECLLFGRAVDRLYLRSGLSLLAELNLNGKEERATLKIPASHDRYSPENLQSRAVHPLLGGIRLT